MKSAAATSENFFFTGQPKVHIDDVESRLGRVFIRTSEKNCSGRAPINCPPTGCFFVGDIEKVFRLSRLVQ